MCFLNFQFLFAISNFYIGQNECLPIVSYSICVSRIGCPYLEIIFVRCPHKHKCCFIGKAFFVSSLDFRSTAQECHLRVCAVITDTWDWTTRKDHNYSGCWVHLVRCEKRRQKAKWQETKLVSSSPFIMDVPIAGLRTLKLVPSSAFIVGTTSSRVQSLQSLARHFSPSLTGEKGSRVCCEGYT